MRVTLESAARWIAPGSRRKKPRGSPAPPLPALSPPVAARAPASGALAHLARDEHVGQLDVAVRDAVRVPALQGHGVGAAALPRVRQVGVRRDVEPDARAELRDGDDARGLAVDEGGVVERVVGVERLRRAKQVQPRRMIDHAAQHLLDGSP